jgi:hypothetical protein
MRETRRSGDQAETVPLPAALVHRGIGGVLCCEGRPAGKSWAISISRRSSAGRSAEKLLMRNVREKLPTTKVTAAHLRLPLPNAVSGYKAECKCN